jgi:hypothetical protein
VAELALGLEANGWPVGTRAICRRERPHPGAQLSFSDEGGYRFLALARRAPRLAAFQRLRALPQPP